MTTADTAAAPWPDGVEREARYLLARRTEAERAADQGKPVYAVLAPPTDAGRPWQVRGLWRDGKEQRG